MIPAAFGWSSGDLFILVQTSVQIYNAFNDARKNSTRQFQLLTDEFGRFQTFLCLLHDLLQKHNRPLYFGYDQFKRTLEECDEFLQKYSSLADRRPSVSKIIRVVVWTTEDRTIDRLRKDVTGHAHVLGLYTNYLNL